jgi:hypothetical protein
MTMRVFVIMVLCVLAGLPDGSIAQTGVVGRTARGVLGAKPDPARLAVDFRVTTPSGSGLLFENESGVLHLAVSNGGDLPAHNVVARITLPREAEGLILDSTLLVGDIAPGDTATINHPIVTTIIRSRQDVILFVEVTDSVGFLVRQPVLLSLDKSSASLVTAGNIPETKVSRAQQLADIFSGARNWLLVIGIDKYVHWPELGTPVRDAKTLRDVLLRRYGFETRYLVELFDSDATRASVIRSLEYLARVVRPEDNVVMYFGGHGWYDPVLGRGYWIPVNADLETSSDFLPNTEILAFLSAINSRATLVISDACFSGTLFRAKPQEAQNDRYFLEVSKLKARQALISGGNEPVMDSGISSEHSVFAYYLLDRLRTNQDRYLTAGTLFERIKVPISNSSLQTPQCKPISNTGDEGGEFVFVRRR